ncbi:hypothetical protein ONE63_007966 [Megalurothrips usitatus]|uniref:Uncharacterized protein n=1 Tax=Megalurothrips usitatus TaxID=439358 RepID=A0AAV7XTF7_9NEOP|nr:hypothetical protein ONE63_007966 [Megalurothrips usitatus]
MTMPVAASAGAAKKSAKFRSQPRPWPWHRRKRGAVGLAALLRGHLSSKAAPAGAGGAARGTARWRSRWPRWSRAPRAVAAITQLLQAGAAGGAGAALADLLCDLQAAVKGIVAQLFLARPRRPAALAPPSPAASGRHAVVATVSAAAEKASVSEDAVQPRPRARVLPAVYHAVRRVGRAPWKKGKIAMALHGPAGPLALPLAMAVPLPLHAQ